MAQDGAVTGSSGLTAPADLRRVYDSQLREQAELATAERWERHGPLLWAEFGGGQGFVTYGAPPPRDRVELAELVAATVAHFSARPAVTEIEWKTRGHDPWPDLDAVLVEHGFVAGERESVMLGEAALLDQVLPLPSGVSVDRITARADIEEMAALADAVFGSTTSRARLEELVRRPADGVEEIELWVARAQGQVVSAGRLEPVPGTDVAGIWGGGTLPAWRGRGIYRVLLAERARSALRRGYRLLHSDSTAASRPILERTGFVRVTTTTPYVWAPDQPH